MEPRFSDSNNSLPERNLSEREFEFDSIQKKHNVRRYIALSILSFFILAGITWIIFASYLVLKTPTLQTQSSNYLLKYIASWGNKSSQLSIIKEAEKKRIYIWPQEGIEINDNEESFPDDVWNLLVEKYPTDIPNLSNEEKNLMLTFTFPLIRNSIKVRIESGEILTLDSSRNLLSKKEKQIQTSLPKYIGFNRYEWLGFTKVIYFILIKEDSKSPKIIFASVSDIADKTSFLTSILMPLALLIISVSILLLMNLSSYRKQGNHYKLENRLFSANSFTELIQIVRQEFSVLELQMSSISLQVLRDDGFTLYYDGEKKGIPKTSLVSFEQSSLSFKRMSGKNHDKPFIYENFNKSDLENKYSLTIPIIEAEKKYAFINFNFKARGFGFSKIFFVHKAFFAIQTAFANIHSSMENTKEQDWKEMKQWINSKRETPPDLLFDKLREKLNTGNFIYPLPELTELELVHLKENNWFHFYKDSIAKSIPTNLNSKDELLEKKRVFISRFENHYNILIPIQIKKNSIFVYLKIIEEEKLLTYFTIEYLELIFNEYAKQVDYYYNTILKETIRNEFIYASTGLQNEVKEIIEQKTNRIYENWDSMDVKSKIEIDAKIKTAIEDGKIFSEFGFGSFIELDLSKSSKLNNIILLEDVPSYENAIESANDYLFSKIEGIENSFTTRNKSGGDGDSVRFFFTSQNNRVGKKLSNENSISIPEKIFYTKKILKNLIDTNDEFFRRRIPMKLGYFPLDSDFEMRISLDRGIFKIHSYLQGLVDFSRAEKSFRLTREGKEIKTIEPIFPLDESETYLGVAPKQVFQPWSIIIPTAFIEFLSEDTLGKYSVQNFYLKNSVDLATLKPSQYSELIFKGHYSTLYRIYPELSRIPSTWNYSIAKLIAEEIFQFSKSKSGEVENILNDFISNRKISNKEQVFPISKNDLLHFLTTDKKSIRGKGLFMSLEQTSPLSLRTGEFKKHLERLLEEDLPTLKLLHEKANSLLKILSELNLSPMKNEDTLLLQANRIFND